MSFFLDVESANEEYVAVRDSERNRLVRDFVDELWREFRDIAEPNFQLEGTRQFHQRFWEMYLAVSLRRRGYEIESRGVDGPDFVLPASEGSIWLEATAPGPGNGPDSVPQVQYRSGMADRVPEERIILRMINSIQSKLGQFTRAVEAESASADDAYVIALNGRKIRDAMYDAEVPYILKAVYPLGPYTVVFDRENFEQVDAYHQYRPHIQKNNGAEVTTELFGLPGSESVSAVLYSYSDCANHPVDLGQEYALVHNDSARNPLPEGFFPFGVEYVSDGETISKKEWAKDEA